MDLWLYSGMVDLEIESLLSGVRFSGTTLLAVVMHLKHTFKCYVATKLLLYSYV